MNISSAHSTHADDRYLPLMRIVERAVRPLRAHSARKRRMRDELLTHLSAIYEEEVARLSDPLSAIEAVARRFGDPAKLTAELQAAVPHVERWGAVYNSWFDWRAPESVTRWMARLTGYVFCVMLFTCGMAALVAAQEFGWTTNLWLAIRPLIATVFVLPTSVAASGICYYKVRDHIFGVFGSRRSWGQAFAWAGLLAAVIAGCGFLFLAVAYQPVEEIGYL